LYKNTNDKFYTMEEYLPFIETNQTDKDNNKVLLYTNDSEKQHSFIENANANGYDVLVFDELIDSHFIGHVEHKNTGAKLVRVDADTIDKIIDKGESKESMLSAEGIENLDKYFKMVVTGDKYEFKTANLSPNDPAVVITRPEFERRMSEMQSMGGGMPWMTAMGEKYNVVVNTNHKISHTIAEMSDEGAAKEMAGQAFDLALLGQNMLQGEALTNFIKRSYSILGEK